MCEMNLERKKLIPRTKECKEDGKCSNLILPTLYTIRYREHSAIGDDA